MDEKDSVHQRLGLTEKAMAQMHRTDPLLYAELFELHARLRRQAERIDADADVSRARREVLTRRERLVASS